MGGLFIIWNFSYFFLGGFKVYHCMHSPGVSSLTQCRVIAWSNLLSFCIYGGLRVSLPVEFHILIHPHISHLLLSFAFCSERHKESSEFIAA